ncbi:hypothetical protein WA026_007783 [Henosepilachna vigintioctopunctata]|uniref:Uncharacterized protein n=1 Tax=Henosepilachna vigintioctopunctata TaxID=420089 RepID=A0AAW1U5I4_9CUCU
MLVYSQARASIIELHGEFGRWMKVGDNLASNRFRFVENLAKRNAARFGIRKGKQMCTKWHYAHSFDDRSLENVSNLKIRVLTVVATYVTEKCLKSKSYCNGEQSR